LPESKKPFLTIVFTDVVSSTITKRAESLGRDDRERDQTYLREIQTPHFNLIRECYRAHSGEEVSTIGDAFYLIFESPLEAVRCAVDIQKRLVATPIKTPLGPLQLRIGIHSGYPERFEEGWHGADVDMAARVESVASKGQILLSTRTHELVRTMADVKFYSRGEFALKGVGVVELWEADWDGKGPRPTNVRSLTDLRRRKQIWLAAGAAVLVLIAADVGYRYYASHRSFGQESGRNATPRPPGERPSVAVLEFQNRGAPADGWLGMTLAGLLTTELSAGGEIRAISNDDVAATANDYSLAGMITFSHEVLGKLGKVPQADYAVRGSYTVAGDTSARAIHIDLELDDARTSAKVFGSGYVGDQAEINDLAKRISLDLRDKLAVQAPSDAEAKAAQESYPTDSEVLRLYNEGLEKLKTLDAVAARDDLLKVVSREPHFALAHEALANAWEVLGYDKNAEKEATKAYEDSKGLGERDSILIEARYCTLTQKWDRAIEIYRSLWGGKHDEPKYMLEIAGVLNQEDMGQEALKTLDALRHTFKEFTEDPRVDYEEALADEKLSDVKAQHVAAARAASRASAEGAQLLAGYAEWQDCAALFALGVLDDAEKACAQANSFADFAGGRLIQARANTLRGRIMQQRGRLPQALELHKSALSIARDVGSQKDVIGAFLNIAEVESSEGQIDESQKDQQQAFDVAERIGDTQQIVEWENNRGADLQTTGKCDDAKAMFQQELITATGVGNKQGMSDALLNLGALLLETGEPATAEQDTKQSLDIARKARLKNEELGALGTLGDIRMARGDLGGARTSYEEGLKLSLQSGDEADAASSRLGLAKLAIENGDAKTAEAQSRQASEGLEKFVLVDQQGDALDTLARALIAQGETADARGRLDHAGQIGVQDVVVKISLAVTAAKLDSLAGNIERSAQILDSSLADAKRMQLVKLQLEIRLAKLETDPSLRNSAAIPRLEAIQHDARSSGYLEIAARAGHLRRGM